MENCIPLGAGHLLDEKQLCRFWSKVNFSGGLTYREDQLVEQSKVAGECWLWVGEVGGRKMNYGFLRTRGKRRAAHRVSFMDFGNNIPDNYQLDHLCRNTLCVNPDHLEPVTNRENTLRGSLASHGVCRNGHDLTLPGALYKRSDAVRCRACSRISLHRSRASKRA